MKIVSAEICDSRCETDGAERATVYGVRVCYDSGETVFCPDVNASRQVVERLCARLPGNEVDREALWEILCDFAVITE